MNKIKLKDFYKFNLLQTIQSIHGEITGSSANCLSLDEICVRIKWLRMRLKRWDYSNSSSYDDCVNKLLNNVLADVDFRKFGEQ